jgi:hypothetical protein
MSPAEHKFTTPLLIQEFEPPRHAPLPASYENEVDIPVAEVESVHDLSEALALSSLALSVRRRKGHTSHTTAPHAV